MNIRSRSTQILLCLTAVAVLGFFAYANVLGGDFVWDDVYLIRDNPLVRDWQALPKFFVTDIGAGVGHAFNSYRPVQMLTYVVDHSLWPEGAVWGFHLSSTLYHVLASAGVFAVIYLLYHNVFIAFLTGAFFVVHPVHTEAVAYLSGRADSLAALFILSSLCFYVKGLEIQKRSWLTAAVLSYVLALLTRENSLVLPVLLLLYHYSFRKKFAVKTWSAMAVLSVGYMALRRTFFDFSIPGSVPETTVLERLPGVFVAFFNYVRLLVLPLGLHMEYGNAPQSFVDPRSVAGVLLVGVVLALIVETRKHRGPVFFGLSWFMLCLLPVSNLYPINAYMAEHWLYLPSIGLFLIAAWATDLGFKRHAYRPALWPAAAFVLAAWACLTMLQNRHWQNDTAFYEHTVRYAPDSPRMINGLALAYYDQGRTEDAIRVFERAVQRFPDEAFYRNNLGALYLASGQVDLAEQLFRQALAIDPEFANARKNLGIIAARQKDQK